jgi:hypothetical protein
LDASAAFKVSAIVFVLVAFFCFLNPESLEAIVCYMVDVLAALGFWVNFLPSLRVAAIDLVFLTIYFIECNKFY